MCTLYLLLDNEVKISYVFNSIFHKKWDYIITVAERDFEGKLVNYDKIRFLTEKDLYNFNYFLSKLIACN